MNYQQKLFSIVIASYNHAFYLDKAIRSVINQDFDNYELIIIDGGSSDNSIEVIKKYEDKIAYWISEPDNGQSDAFNKGFKKATGKFGFWLNADDLLLPNSLNYMATAISRFPDGDWFVGNTIFIDKDDKIVKCRRGGSWSTLLAKNSVVEVYGPSSIYKISLLNEVGGFDESMYYSMDTDLWIRFVKAGHRFIRINKYIWGFRLHEDSKSSDSYTEEDEVPKYVLENNRILLKNEWRHSKTKGYLKSIRKFIGGKYFMSYIDTFKSKGKKIDII